MALIHMSSSRRYAFLPEPRVEEAPGLDQLIIYAAKQGLTLGAYEAVDPNDILQNTEYPLLLLLREEGGLHMALLHSRRGSHFLLLDPAKGLRRMKGQEVAAAWTGQFLRIEGYAKKGEPPEIPSLLHNLPFQNGILFVLALLPMAWMIAGVSLLSYPLPFPLILACFLMSLASSAGEKFFLLGAMDRFDKRYMDGVDAKFLKRRRDLYVHYHAYKRAAFVSKSEVFGHLSTVVAALIFFLFFDATLSCCLAITVACAVTLHLFFEPHLHDLRQRCESLEGTYFFALVEAPRRKELREGLREKSRGYAMLLSIKQTLLVVLALCSALAFCLVQNNLSAQIVIFYALSSVYIAFETARLFSSHALLEQKKREEPYFLLNIYPYASPTMPK